MLRRQRGRSQHRTLTATSSHVTRPPNSATQISEALTVHEKYSKRSLPPLLERQVDGARMKRDANESEIVARRLNLDSRLSQQQLGLVIAEPLIRSRSASWYMQVEHTSFMYVSSHVPSRPRPGTVLDSRRPARPMTPRRISEVPVQRGATPGYKYNAACQRRL